MPEDTLQLSPEHAAKLAEYITHRGSRFKHHPSTLFLTAVHLAGGAPAVADVMQRLQSDDFTFTDEEKRILPVCTTFSDATQQLSRRSILGMSFGAGFAAVTASKMLFSEPPAQPPAETESSGFISGRHVRDKIPEIAGGCVASAAVYGIFRHMEKGLPLDHRTVAPLVEALDRRIAQETDTPLHVRNR